MLRPLCIVSTILLAGCATRPAELPGGNGMPAVRLVADGLPLEADPAPESPAPTAANEDLALRIANRGPELQYPQPYPPPYPPQPSRGLPRNQFTIKGGYYGAEEGALDDDGFIVNMAWTQFVNQPFAVEFEIGYLEADGRSRGFDTEVWGVPLMVNGRLDVPVGPLDVYGGLGIGSIYYDAEATGTLISVETDGFLFAGNAFVGAALNLADRFTVGIEGKYYLTEEMNNLDADLDAYAVMLTFGFR